MIRETLKLFHKTLAYANNEHILGLISAYLKGKMAILFKEKKKHIPVYLLNVLCYKQTDTYYR